MKYTFTLFISFLSLLSIQAQNLIHNSSFEQLLQPYCEGWYNTCGKEITCDTLGECSTVMVEDSPGDSTVDKWCLLVWGNTWPFENHVDYYVTGRTGTFIYEMKFWMNSKHFYGQGILGIIDHGKFIGIDSLDDSGKSWTEYNFKDTITTVASDTIAVRLAAGLGDFCICDVYFDNVELNVLDSLSTGVDDVSVQNEIEVFPNPVVDHLQISGQSLSNTLITMFNVHGQRVMEKRLNDDESFIDLSALIPGLYYYKVTESKNKMVTKSGNLVKR